ncbi:acetoacetate--CoA ligase [Aureimonas sp. AU4]|uniref:acetoacetate--CoA ligase n=1 Tax=Aureimonas sp. AU4 TaxID=1638163 RepID=UPI000A5C5365|nr:acetoacetate--CoA ligase [Aureimonas sp. AU4]
MLNDVLWSPPASAFEDSCLARFAKRVGIDPRDYAALHAWSVADPGAFWTALWDHTGVVGDRIGPALLRDEAAPMTGARFFPEARLNFAENLLTGDGARPAVVLAGEDGVQGRVTLGELRQMTAEIAAGLREAGVGPGDRVAGVLANDLEALVALLATAALGAVWSSCSPDFGAGAILDRIGQIEPKVLFACERYRYNGRDHDIADRIAEIAAGIPSLQLLVRCGEKQDRAQFPIRASTSFGELRRPGAVFAPVRMPFASPLFVLYTSGTTGAPKAIVHGVGGVVLQHRKEHALHGDVRPGDVVSWYTNTAWMMYHWLISSLSCGAAIVLIDGAAMPRRADGPDLDHLWRIAEDARITHFGTSPKYLAVLQQNGYRPGERRDLSALRSLLSAGAPVSPAQFDWVYDAVKSDMVFASISGGTEILGCFVLGAPTLPVRRGQLTAKGLGLAVNVMDERNAPLIGREGDLVCTEPFPSMPLTFWGEGGDERYRRTYFADRPEIWTHGDIAELTPHGSAIIHGRSDTTLKPGGVRIGTAEIYAVCESLAEIEDALVFGRLRDGDEEVVLCLKMREGRELTQELTDLLRRRIRTEASPRHVPHEIREVAGIPYTLNGKRVETAARAVVAGQVVRNLASLQNPECLEEYRRLGSGKAA